MTSALSGDFKIVSRRLAARRRNWLAAIAFSLGVGTGIFWSMNISPSCAGAAPKMISSAVLGVGEHLCKPHEGLANVTRLETNLYAFTCRELAEFPRVPVILAPQD